MLKFLASIVCIFVLGEGCTYSIIMNHTEGQASDVVDENQTASPDIRPSLTIPLKSGL